MLKLFYFDLETTGTLFWKHGIHQISGMIEIDGVKKQTFDFKVRPNPVALIDDEALKIGNVSKEQIMAYPPMGEVYKQITDMLGKYVDKYDKKDKFFLVGYNSASFDNPFFRAFFKQNNDEYFGSWFWSSGLDVMILAANFFKHKRGVMENFQLRTVARALGIIVDETKLHDAQYDIMLTEQMFKILTKGK